jgi:TorA maturation chaperone TorD
MNANAEIAHDGELPAQDAARADLYAIIGRFFYDAPDAALLAAIVPWGDEKASESGPLGAAWHELREACGRADLAALKQEFDDLFVGVGKSEITPFSSRYVKGVAPDHHLVRLRQLLESWRLGRRGAATETEDHVSGICDVMRLLILDGRPIDEQCLFFNEFVYSGLVPFCEAIGRSARASFYRCVAQFALAFLTVEKAAFDMQDA